MPDARMSAPLTSREMPMNNQIERDPPTFIALSYQKMICRMKNAIATSTPQKPGRRKMETGGSGGMGVNPYTRPVNSASGLGLDSMLTTNVTPTQISQHHSARNMFCA